MNNDSQLQDYVKEYYRQKLSETINHLQYRIMNGKRGAVCSFIKHLYDLFGKKNDDVFIIDFKVTNEDIASFCGISTRNSVNRILRSLKEDGIIRINNHQIVILNLESLLDEIAY